MSSLLLQLGYRRVAGLRTFAVSPGIIHISMTQDAFKPYALDHVELPGMMALYLSQSRADYLIGSFVGINGDIKEMEAHQTEIVQKKLLKLQLVAANLQEGGHPFESYIKDSDIHSI
jgi:hypothetical protein